MDLLFIQFNFVDLLDIILVAIILYQLYLLTRGTAAIKIFIGILAIYLLWKLVSAFHMEMLDEILGQFIGVGVIALMIVFQQELRNFLLFIGNTELFGKRKSFLGKILGSEVEQDDAEIKSITDACQRMSEDKCGALIVLQKSSNLEHFISSQTLINGRLSSSLLESIFFKNSPLHDGAVLISSDQIISARGVLPVSSNPKIDANLGMRHRAALGITEDTDAIAIVVSEETGKISLARDGRLKKALTTNELESELIEAFTSVE